MNCDQAGRGLIFKEFFGTSQITSLRCLLLLHIPGQFIQISMLFGIFGFLLGCCYTMVSLSTFSQSIPALVCTDEFTMVAVIVGVDEPSLCFM